MIDSPEVRHNLARRWFDIVLGILLTLIVLVAAALMVKYLLFTDATKARPVGLPIPVQTLPATVTTLREVVGASGTMGESTDAFLTNRVIARVLSVPVDVGNVVQKGALLAQLDDTYFLSAVEHARTNHDHTSAQLQRMLAMQTKGYASAVEDRRASCRERVC